MIPADQTNLEDGRGNCLTACVATLLDLPIGDVPNFIEREDMFKACRDWLAARGFKMLEFYFSDVEQLKEMYFEPYGEFCILSGLSPRKKADGGKKYHAVVGKTVGYGVEVVHDPHPSRDGLADEGHRYLRFIVKV